MRKIKIKDINRTIELMKELNLIMEDE
jgi:hypothetical protein